MSLFGSQRNLNKKLKSLRADYEDALDSEEYDKAESIKNNISYLEDERNTLDLKRGGWLQKSLMGTLTKEDVDKVVRR